MSTVYVKNIDSRVSIDDLLDVMTLTGNIKWSKMYPSKGLTYTGLIQYHDQQCADSAIRNLNHVQVGSTFISVSSYAPSTMMTKPIVWPPPLPQQQMDTINVYPLPSTKTWTNVASHTVSSLHTDRNEADWIDVTKMKTIPRPKDCDPSNVYLYK